MNIVTDIFATALYVDPSVTTMSIQAGILLTVILLPVIAGIIVAIAVPAHVRKKRRMNSPTPDSRWVMQNGLYYFVNSYNIPAKKQWIRYNGAAYYLDENGVRVTNTVKVIDGRPCRFDAEGRYIFDAAPTMQR